MSRIRHFGVIVGLEVRPESRIPESTRLSVFAAQNLPPDGPKSATKSMSSALKRRVLSSIRSFPAAFLVATVLCVSAWAQEDAVDLRGKLRINVDMIDLEYLREVVQAEAPSQTMQLTLDDCVRLALDKNQDIIVAEYDPMMAESDILSAHGEFDPFLSSNVTYTHAKQDDMAVDARTGAIKDAKFWNTTSTTALSGKLKYGTQYNLSLDVDKSESTASHFIEHWTTGLTLSLTQPLVRDRGKKLNLTRIELAENARTTSVSQLRLTVLNKVAEVAKAYWDLVGAVDTMKVREESLKNAERLLGNSEILYKVGKIAATEVLQAKAGVAMRQSDLIFARSQIRDAEDTLRRLLNLRDGEFFGHARLVPTQQPEVPEFDLGAVKNTNDAVLRSTTLALKNRPEIHMAELNIERAAMDKRLKRNELLPQIDLIASVGQSGDDHFMSRSFTNLRHRKDNSYSIGFMGSVPLGNRLARGQHLRSKHMVKQAEQYLERVRQDLMLGIRVATRNVATSRILVESNRQTRKLQEANVAAEETRLQLGFTTSWRVLQIEEELTRAQTQEVQARIGYLRALVDLQLIQGTLLEDLGLDFEVPETEEPIGFLDSINPF